MQNQNQQREEIRFVFHVEPDGSIDPKQLTKGSALPELPPKVYTLASELGRGLYLKPENDFKLPTKLYGKITNYADRFLRAYELGSKNMGALLIGDAGSGKTLTLKQVVTKGAELGMPTILINEAYPSSMIVAFLNTITQPVILCFDEFDKTYGKGGDGDDSGQYAAQNGILQLLDGASAGAKKLVIFTANDDSSISPYMKDRPSRVRYTIRYSRIDPETVIDYVTQNLKNCTEDHLRAFLLVAIADANASNGMNFDSMVELVNEMNNFGCSLDEARELMMRNGKSAYTNFEVTIFENDQKKEVVPASGHHRSAYIATGDYDINVKVTVPSDDDPEFPVRRVIRLTKDDFVGFGEDHTVYEFKQGDRTFIVRQRKLSAIQTLESLTEAEYQSMPAVQERSKKAAEQQMSHMREHHMHLRGAHSFGMSSSKHLDGPQAQVYPMPR